MASHFESFHAPIARLLALSIPLGLLVLGSKDIGFTLLVKRLHSGVVFLGAARLLQVLRIRLQHFMRVGGFSQEGPRPNALCRQSSLVPVETGIALDQRQPIVQQISRRLC